MLLDAKAVLMAFAMQLLNAKVLFCRSSGTVGTRDNLPLIFLVLTPQALALHLVAAEDKHEGLHGGMPERMLIF